MARERLFEDIDLVEGINKGESVSDLARRFNVSPAAISKRIRLLRERGVLPEKEPQSPEEWKGYWLQRFEGEVLRRVVDVSTELKAELAELKRLKNKVDVASRRLDEIEEDLEKQRQAVSGGDSPAAIGAIARLKAEREAIEEAVVALGSKISHQEMVVQGLQERFRDALSPAMTEVKAEGIIKARHLYERLKALRDGFHMAQTAFAGKVRTEFEIANSLKLLPSNEKGIFSEKHLGPLERFFADYDRRKKEAERLRLREKEEEEKLEKATKELGFEPPVCRLHEVPVVMQDHGLKEMPNFTVRRIFKCPEPLCSNKITILDEDATKRLQESGPPICRNHYNNQPVKMTFVHNYVTDKGIVKIFLCPQCKREISIPDPEATAQWFGKKGCEIDERHGRSAKAS